MCDLTGAKSSSGGFPSARWWLCLVQCRCILSARSADSSPPPHPGHLDMGNTRILFKDALFRYSTIKHEQLLGLIFTKIPHIFNHLWEQSYKIYIFENCNSKGTGSRERIFGQK